MVSRPASSTDGKETRVEVPVPRITGSRLLPLTVTGLTSLRPGPEARHFLEAFLLVPFQVNRWTLIWFVGEIVRDTLVEVTIEEVGTFDGEQPPGFDVADLRRLATVRVNADGDAEWVVLSGADQRGDVIETDAERQELAAEKRARDAADQKVDWSLRRAIERAPSFAYAASGSSMVRWRTAGPPTEPRRSRSALARPHSKAVLPGRHSVLASHSDSRLLHTCPTDRGGIGRSAATCM